MLYNESYYCFHREPFRMTNVPESSSLLIEEGAAALIPTLFARHLIKTNIVFVAHASTKPWVMQSLIIISRVALISVVFVDQ